MTAPNNPQTTNSNVASSAEGGTPPKAISAYPGGSSPNTSTTTNISTQASPATTQSAKATTPSQKPAVNAALKKRPPRNPSPGRGSTFLALLAIVVALGSGLVALYALNVARQAKSNAAAAASDAHRLAGPGPTAAPPAAGPSASAAPGPTTPAPVFLSELHDINLAVPATDGCQSIFVDVDTGQVGNYTGHDFYFSACVGPLTVYLDNVDGAVATGGNTTPDACAALLTGATPSTPVQIPATPGTTFCLVTSKAAASRAGIPQHLAVVQIRQVNPDHSATATLNTYRLNS